MHHMRVALDEEAVRDLYASRGSDAADIVAAKVKQHQMFGAFLGIARELDGKCCIFLQCVAPSPCSRDRSYGDRAVAQSHEDFRTGTNNGKSRQRQMVEEGRRIEAAERAVKREGRKHKRPAKTLAWHHLEHVAGADVVLRTFDDGKISGPGHIGFDTMFRRRLHIGRRRRQRTIKARGRPE